MEGGPEKVFQLTECHVSLLVLCSYWPWILCLKAHFLSVCMYVMVFQDKHTLTKWNILSNCLLVHSRERIFHFGRVCLSWKTITYIQTERKWAFRHSMQGQNEQRTSWLCHSYRYIHATVQNQVSWHYTNIMKNSNFSVMDHFHHS